MKKFFLTEIITRDQLIHQGIFYPPSHKATAGKANQALLLVHGLTSAFYRSLAKLEAFSKYCEKYNYGFAAFNNRGHEIITGIKKIDKSKPTGTSRINGGAAYEDFTESIYDIEAGIDFLNKQGFNQIVLVGSSTGATKVAYYASIKNNPNVQALVLTSPVNDRFLSVVDQKLVQKLLPKMRKLVREGKGDELVLVDNPYGFPLTPKRIISVFEPGSSEDIFDYDTPNLTQFSKIKKPLLVIFGEQDEYLDRPAKDVIKMFDKYQKSANYKSVIIPKATHSFNGKENELVKTIFDWIKSL